MNQPGSNSIPLAISPPHDCAYLPGRVAVAGYAAPEKPLDNLLYSRLVQMGFRRSGEHIYRPFCPYCSACVPVRIPVLQHTERRRGRRIRSINRDIQVSSVRPQYTQEYYDLYMRYLSARHAGGGMDETEPGQFLEFLTSEWSDTWFHVFRRGSQLLAVAVTDHLRDALSAVYTFYDPALTARSLGTFTIQWQIREARRLGLRWLYLGYWIEECKKMSYKGHFRPLQEFRDGQWLDL